MSEIETYDLSDPWPHRAKLAKTEGQSGEWVKKKDHEAIVGAYATVGEMLTERLEAFENGTGVVDIIAAQVQIAKLESEKKMLRAGDCPECEAMVRAADDEEMLSGVVALANGAVVKLRFPEAELERFVEIATNGDCLLRAIVPPDGWTCELLAPGYAPREREEPAVQSIATGPHWAGEGVVRTCGRCGESGLLDIMRCKCADEGGE